VVPPYSSIDCVANSANGPAANAKTYVLMGWVSSNVNIWEEVGSRGPCVTGSKWSSMPDPISFDGVFETTRQLSFTVGLAGTIMLSVNLAFRSGWSKTGNAVLASEGTKRE